eukprot:6183452-Pleurochrysis_carterae.AAC.3
MLCPRSASKCTSLAVMPYMSGFRPSHHALPVARVQASCACLTLMCEWPAGLWPSGWGGAVN